MLMGTSALIYARVVGQVVHNEPTLYDKVFNRPYYLEWTAEQAKKKAEEKKKEEEAKLKKVRLDLGAQQPQVSVVLSLTAWEDP